MFQFSGELEISKSWMNRALILQSFSPELQIKGDSQADDVKLLKKALIQFKNNETEFYAGLGGTTFRFLAFRISRKPGTYLIRADQKLLSRPQGEIVNVLNQLGVEAKLTEAGLKIHTTGWKCPATSLKVETNESSQFLSAVALSSVDLDFDLNIIHEQKIISEGYFQMTLDLLRSVGIQNGKAHQTIQSNHLQGEIDISSAFALIAAAILNGNVEIKNWNQNFTQPDIQFINFLKTMGIQFSIENNCFKVLRQSNYKCLKADLSSCPDLFPVLSVLCAFAEGESHLFNAPQLKHKESDRIEKTTELLRRCGFEVKKLNDGLMISGDPTKVYKARDIIIFDPDHDHRMAMAAGLLILKGFPIQLSDKNVVNKSYPQFFQHIGLNV